MKGHNKAGGDARLDGSHEEMRELAESLSLFRSAMHHIAEREAARPWAMARPPAHRMRLRLLLAPALAAVVAAGVLVPLYTHDHRHHAEAAARTAAAQRALAENLASMDDTMLMNHIFNAVSEDVPDALQPLADLSAQAAAQNTSVSERRNVTQE